MLKPRLWNKEDKTRDIALWTLNKVLTDGLKLLHPFMPFITEEIFKNLNEDEESIMISSWPEYSKDFDFANEMEAVENIKEAVRSIRNVRTNMNVPPSKKAKVFIVSSDESLRNIYEESKNFMLPLAYASEIIVKFDNEGIDEDAVATVAAGANIFMPFAELVDTEKEIERLQKEEKKLEAELSRVTSMLSNEKFTSKAPQAKIDEEKAKLEKYQMMMNQVKEQLEKFKK